MLDAAGDATDIAQLRSSLQRLARSGSDQQPLFPEPGDEPGRLAAEFDRCAAAVLNGEQVELSPAARKAITAVSRKLETMSRDQSDFDVDLWTEASVRTSEPWAEVRRLAALALETL